MFIFCRKSGNNQLKKNTLIGFLSSVIVRKDRVHPEKNAAIEIFAVFSGVKHKFKVINR